MPSGNRDQTVGNGADFVAQAPSGHVFSLALGSFPTVTGVKSEKSVGVAAFGDGGVLGNNEYTLQVNTNFFHSAACGSFANCLAWQQYVLSTNTPVSLTSNRLTGDTEVFKASPGVPGKCIDPLYVVSSRNLTLRGDFLA